jgi:hypothetical protein
MAIKPMVGSRLVYGVAGSGVALCFLLLTLTLLREGNAFAVFGLIMVAILGFIAYFGARAAVLQANETSIVYRPTSGLKGTTYFSFRSPNGQELFHAGETYSRNDMEALASYLGVPIRWELTTPR